MSTFYQARYYDGQSARPWAATVSIFPEQIVIRYGNDEGRPLIRYWAMDQLRAQELQASGVSVLKYGDFPSETLEIDEPGVFESLRAARPGQYRRTTYRWLLHQGPKGMLLFALGMIALFVGGYFFVLPPLAEQVAVRMPRSWEVQLGESFYPQLVGTQQIDVQQTEQINTFWLSLGYESTYDIRIAVVESDMVNAFALPGGRIVVFTGMLERMHRPEQLAGLLAHEAAHVEYRHGTRGMMRNLAGYLLLSILIGDTGSITAVLIDNAHTLTTLAFSRRLEEEADRLGLKMMHQAGLDPEGMVDLFVLLQKAHGESADENTPVEDKNQSTVSESDYSTYLSTHPATHQRIAYLRETIEDLPEKQPQYDTTAYRQSWTQLQTDTLESEAAETGTTESDESSE